MNPLEIPSPPDPIAAYRARCASENRAPASIPTPHAAHPHALPGHATDRQRARQVLLLATDARERAEHTEALAVAAAGRARVKEAEARAALAEANKHE